VHEHGDVLTCDRPSAESMPQALSSAGCDYLNKKKEAAGCSNMLLPPSHKSVVLGFSDIVFDYSSYLKILCKL
jgi:hypothetical protein